MVVTRYMPQFGSAGQYGTAPVEEKDPTYDNCKFTALVAAAATDELPQGYLQIGLNSMEDSACTLLTAFVSLVPVYVGDPLLLGFFCVFFCVCMCFRRAQ